MWSKILHIVGGRTVRLARRLGGKRGKQHLCTVLHMRSHRTLAIHGANILKFLAWKAQKWAHVQWRGEEHIEESVTMLVDYVHEL